MGDQTQVDVGGMYAAVTSIADVAANVYTEGDNVRASIDTLLASWTGSSAVAFSAAMDTFYSQANTIVQTLEDLATAVNESANEYSKATEGADASVNLFVSNIPDIDSTVLSNF